MFRRRIRALAGIATTWAIAWAMIGAAILGIRLATGETVAFQPLRLWLRWEGSFAFWGALAGIAFGFAVMAAGRSRRLSQLSMARFAGLGAVAGAILPGVVFAWPLLSGRSGAVGAFVVSAAIGAGVGAVCAATALLIARGLRRRVVEPSDPAASLREGEPDFANDDLRESRVV